MSLFNTLTIETYTRTGGDYSGPDRDWVPGGLSAEPTYITGTWVPAPGKVIDTLPEGKRGNGVFILTTMTQQTITDQDTGTESNVIISPIDGKQYELIRDMSSQNRVISHYAYIATRYKEAG